MDPARFDRLARSFVATGSRRRAAGAAVVSLGSLLGILDVAAGKKKKKKKKKKKNPPPACPSGQSLCAADGTCCQDTRCHARCGCCPESAPSCCAGTNNAFCYTPNEEQCCPEAEAGIAGACRKGTICGPKLGGAPLCCDSGDEVCTAGCCSQGTFCCSRDGVCCDNVACQPAPEGSCFPQPLGSPARYA